METEDTKLLKFNRTNLVKEISRVVKIDKKFLMHGVTDFIWPRLDFLKGKRRSENRYFLFEDSYVETEWKDMISIHYINTSYKVQNTVMRVHIFIENEMTDDAYIGFFTLRKVDETRIMLSFIYPDWKKIECRFDGRSETVYVMTYKKKVHIGGKEFSINTYPLFVQDNLTIACAQADIISMSKYLHNKFDNQMFRVKDLGAAYATRKTKLFPTSGLNAVQIIEVFNYCNIPVQYLVIDNKKDVIDENAELYREYVDYSIESGIPVLLGMVITDKKGKKNKHIVQIIGHTKHNRECYIFYDDSGYFLRSLKSESNGFVGAIEWKNLYRIIREEKSYLIYPIHEKVYLSYDEIKEIFKLECENRESIKKLKENELAFPAKTRYLLADNRAVKKFLRNILNNDSLLQKEIDEINRLLEINMSHYVWYCELPLSQGYFIFLADATYGRVTTKDIFYSDAIYSEKQLSLLSYTE